MAAKSVVRRYRFKRPLGRSPHATFRSGSACCSVHTPVLFVLAFAKFTHGTRGQANESLSAAQMLVEFPLELIERDQQGLQTFAFPARRDQPTRKFQPK
jgi:hypothetical protein